jgi:hypothetical protein
MSKPVSYKLTTEICPKCKRGNLLINESNRKLKKCVWTFGCDYEIKETEQLKLNL